MTKTIPTIENIFTLCIEYKNEIYHQISLFLTENKDLSRAIPLIGLLFFSFLLSLFAYHVVNHKDPRANDPIRTPTRTTKSTKSAKSSKSTKSTKSTKKPTPKTKTKTKTKKTTKAKGPLIAKVDSRLLGKFDKLLPEYIQNATTILECQSIILTLFKFITSQDSPLTSISKHLFLFNRNDSKNLISRLDSRWNDEMMKGFLKIRDLYPNIYSEIISTCYKNIESGHCCYISQDLILQTGFDWDLETGVPLFSKWATVDEISLNSRIFQKVFEHNSWSILSAPVSAISWQDNHLLQIVGSLLHTLPWKTLGPRLANVNFYQNWITADINNKLSLGQKKFFFMVTNYSFHHLPQKITKILQKHYLKKQKREIILNLPHPKSPEILFSMFWYKRLTRKDLGLISKPLYLQLAQVQPIWKNLPSTSRKIIYFALMNHLPRIINPQEKVSIETFLTSVRMDPLEINTLNEIPFWKYSTDELVLLLSLNLCEPGVIGSGSKKPVNSGKMKKKNQ